MTLFFALFLACADDVSSGKTDAVVNAPPTSAPAEAPARAEAPVASQEWPVDVAKSDLHALGAKVTGQETLRFSRWSGKAQVADGVVRGLSFEVDVTSLDTGKERLNTHLNSPDFFDTAQNPKATFQSTRIEAGSSEAGKTHTVTGDLTMRGITNSVTFPMSFEVSGDEAKGSAEFAINRLDWKVAFPGAPDNLIQDKVVLTVKFVAANPNGPTAAL